MAANWYNGTNPIDELTFIECKLKHIENNAFAVPSFENLENLRMFELPLTIQYSNQMFNGLPKLSCFVFYETSIAGIGDNLFGDSRSSFQTLLYDHITYDFSFNQLFARRMPALHNIALSSDLDYSNVSRTLAPANFSRLPVIRYLSFKSCGIATILANTFDYIAYTLKYLNLNNNKLKTLRYEMFAAFLDRYIGNRKYFYFYMIDGLQCDCDFFTLKNVSLISLDIYASVEFEKWQRASICHEYADRQPVATCDELDSIDPIKICLAHNSIRKYSYPKFGMRLDRQMLEINSTARREYRLWIVNHRAIAHEKRAKCPCNDWIQGSVTCLLFANESVSISLGKFLQRSELTTIGIIYVMANKNLWPLHMVTVHEMVAVRVPLQALFLQATFVAGCGIFSGLAIIICYRRTQLNIESVRLVNRIWVRLFECKGNYSSLVARDVLKS